MMSFKKILITSLYLLIATSLIISLFELNDSLLDRRKIEVINLITIKANYN